MSSLSGRLRTEQHQGALFASIVAPAATLVSELKRASRNHASQLAEVDFLVRWIEANMAKLRSTDLTRVGTLQRALIAKFERARTLLNRSKATEASEHDDAFFITAARKSALLADIKSHFSNGPEDDFELRMQAIKAQIDRMRERHDANQTNTVFNAVDVASVARKTATMRELLEVTSIAMTDQRLDNAKESMHVEAASGAAEFEFESRALAISCSHDDHDFGIGNVLTRRTVRLPRYFLHEYGY